MQRTVTAHTVSRFVGRTGNQHHYQDYTLLLVPMTAQQVAGWKWVGDEYNGTDPVCGWEVRDTTGALLGAILPLGHMAQKLHVEYYSPQKDEFFAAGRTPHAVVSQGIHRVLDGRTDYHGPIATGEGFTLDEPRYLPDRVNCLTGHCPEDCAHCAADEQVIRVV